MFVNAISGYLGLCTCWLCSLTSNLKTFAGIKLPFKINNNAGWQPLNKQLNVHVMCTYTVCCCSESLYRLILATRTPITTPMIIITTTSATTSATTTPTIVPVSSHVCVGVTAGKKIQMEGIIGEQYMIEVSSWWDSHLVWVP